MTLIEWIKKYEKEAEPFKLLDGFKIYFEPSKGFFCWRIKNNIFEIDHTCTNDIRYFDMLTSKLAQKNKCALCRTMSMRNPASYVRITKTHLNLKLSGIRPNGYWYWVFEKEVI